MPNKNVTLPTPDVIAQAVDPDEAIDFWRSRAKLTSDDAEALGDDARHRAFYVSGLARHDLVQLVSDGIEEALKSGETLADFKKRILEAIQAQGWHDYRVENIFRTNVQTAYAAGRYVKMQAVKDSRPYWQYIAIMDSRVRPSHAVMHGKVYPADHAFWSTNYPPNGFRCRCGVRTLSERQLKRQGLTVEKNMPRDGGADKGFRNNPGKDWAEAGLNLKKYSSVNQQSYANQRPQPQANKIEAALGVVQGAPIELTKAAQGTNPNFRKDRSYQINCQRCVPTYELRRRGYPVEALPNLTWRTSRRSELYGWEGVKNVQGEGTYSYAQSGGKVIKPKLTKAQLLKALKAMPDGARVGLIWSWPKQGAHTTVCEKLGGKLYFIDPQSGKIGDEKSLGQARKSWGYSYYRMDNLLLDENFEWDEIAKRETV